MIREKKKKEVKKNESKDCKKNGMKYLLWIINFISTEKAGNYSESRSQSFDTCSMDKN
jgi:hypothetical protein